MIKNMELAQVRRGESFILDGVKFVKLDEDAHASFVLTADVFPKHIPFEHKDAERKDHDNFVGSYLQKHVDIWLHQGHPNISKAVVERPINLLSMCGETVYGTPCVFGRVLTLDEYRRYRKYIPLASDWYWLATSYSPDSSFNDYGDSFHQTYIEEGMAMPRIRLGDKFSRFKTLSRILSSDSDQQAVTDESIRDTLLDLANYSIMTVLEIDDAQHEQEIAEQKTCDEGASNAD